MTCAITMSTDPPPTAGSPSVEAALSDLHAALVAFDDNTRVDPTPRLTTISRKVDLLARTMTLRGLLPPYSSLVPSLFATNDPIFAMGENGSENSGTIVGGPFRERGMRFGSRNHDCYDVIFDDGDWEWDRDRACPAFRIRLRDPTVVPPRPFHGLDRRVDYAEVADVPLFAEIAWRLQMLRDRDPGQQHGAWRTRLAVGDKIDARDTVGLWCEARVVDVVRRSSEGNAPRQAMGPDRGSDTDRSPSQEEDEHDEALRVRITYIGWGEGWNEWIDVDSERIQRWKTRAKKKDQVPRIQRRAMHLLFRVPPVQQLLGPIQEALLASHYCTAARVSMPVDEDPLHSYHNRCCRGYREMVSFLRYEARRRGELEADQALNVAVEGLEPLLKEGKLYPSTAEGDGPFFSRLSGDLRLCVVSFLDPGSSCSFRASRKSFLFLDSAPSFAAALAAQFEDEFRSMTVEDRVRKRFRKIYMEQTASQKRKAEDNGCSERNVRRRLSAISSST